MRISTNGISQLEVKGKDPLAHPAAIASGCEPANFAAPHRFRAIEGEFADLNLKLNPENGIKYFRKALSKFENYLKDTFSLTSNGYYTNIGAGLGSVFGILFGIVVLSILERSHIC